MTTEQEPEKSYTSGPGRPARFELRCGDKLILRWAEAHVVTRYWPGYAQDGHVVSIRRLSDEEIRDLERLSDEEIRDLNRSG
jgi:hypothetical protein